MGVTSHPKDEQQQRPKVSVNGETPILHPAIICTLWQKSSITTSGNMYIVLLIKI